MKRIIAWALVMVLAMTGTALAAEWENGLSPSKPYSGEPEVDLETKLGYVMFYPQADMPVESACQRLYIYLPREDVMAGDGTLYLFTDEDGEVWSVAMNDTEAITQRSINEAELIGLLWGGGTCFEVRLPRSLELGKTYYANMTRGCIVAENGVENPQIGETAWKFAVKGDYGVSGMEYRRLLANGSYEEQILSPEIGDEIRFDLVLGGDATMAAIYKYNDSVDFVTTTFTESCEVIGEVTSENLVWGMIFMDAEGKVLNRVEFW